MHDDDLVVGGYIAMGADELEASRKADAAAILQEFTTEERRTLLGRLAAVRGLLTPVYDGDCYIRASWIVPPFQGCGYGTELKRQQVALARRAGYRRLCGEVAETNRASIRAQERNAFRVVERRTSDDAGMTYLLIQRDLEDP
jgi:RimJ/RimL family protein N-acetyltransferase